jgi:dTDP-4-amino-4,6-dideoxygalactose transaminase
MKKKGVQINKVFDYSTAHLPVFKKYANKDQDLKNSLIAGSNNVNLPCYSQLLNKKHKLDLIIKFIEEYDKLQFYSPDL